MLPNAGAACSGPEPKTGVGMDVVNAPPKGEAACCVVVPKAGVGLGAADAPPKLKPLEAEALPKPLNPGACWGWAVPNAGTAGDCVPNPGAPPACWVCWGAPKLKPAPALPPKGAGWLAC